MLRRLNRTGWVTLAFSLVVGTFGLSLTAQGGTVAGRMTIPDDNTHVLNDGTATYTDYRLTYVPGYSALDYCVNGAVAIPGNVYFSLNRREGFANDLPCSLQDPPGTPRLFRLKIDSAVNCTELQETPVDGSCLVTPDDGSQPYVGAGTVFKAKAKSTLVTFYFRKGEVGYKVHTVAEARLVNETADSKRIEYPNTGVRNPTALVRLSRVVDGRYTEIGELFPLPFELRFERFAIP